MDKTQSSEAATKIEHIEDYDHGWQGGPTDVRSNIYPWVRPAIRGY